MGADPGRETGYDPEKGSPTVAPTGGTGTAPGGETGYDPDKGSPTIAPTGATGYGGTEHGGAERGGMESRTTTPGGIATERGHEATPLFPHDTSDKLELKLQHAVTGFVDGPRAAVEEADHVLEEVAGLITEALTERRRTLRRSWESTETTHGTSGETATGATGKPASSTDTEQLRLALRDYRELAERLLHV
jgi:hypothetical protein